MNPQERDKLIDAIERDEAWLAGVMRRYPHPPCTTLADVRQGVRAALDLEQRAVGGLPGAEHALAAAKSAVRLELRRMADAQPAARRIGPWWRRPRIASVALVAAAAVAFWLAPLAGPVPNMDEGGANDSGAAGTSFEDIRGALALEATDEFDSEVASLSSEIHELYDVLTLGETWDLSGEFEELDADLDELFEDIAS